MTPLSKIHNNGIGRYVLYGDPGNGNTTYTDSTEDVLEAQYMAIGWLVAGFATKVIDLNLAAVVGQDDPSLIYRYNNLNDVQTIIPELTQLSSKYEPQQLPKWPMTLDEFRLWVLNLSQSNSDY